jgi:hypothetical protein
MPVIWPELLIPNFWTWNEPVLSYTEKFGQSTKKPYLRWFGYDGPVTRLCFMMEVEPPDALKGKQMYDTVGKIDTVGLKKTGKFNTAHVKYVDKRIAPATNW